ncbi:MAG: hypothetical protein Q8941_10070 [Bacteroidota bacterium]|nr:hypothetical protein [Bacteroidota bacterium]
MTAIVSRRTVHKENDLFRTISLTALLTGTLDIIAAIIKFYIDTNEGATLKIAGNNEDGPVSFLTFLLHGGPARMFQYIARGAFDGSVTANGSIMIVWGIVFHYMIAFLFTLLLFLMYPKITIGLKNKFIIGTLYGLFTWTVMNLLVVPLSRVPKKDFHIEQAGIDALILIGMIGIPVALIAHHYYSRQKSG